MKKKSFAIALVLLPLTAIFAQTNWGIDYYFLGDYKKAKTLLEKELNTNPVEANFYLGEIAFAEGDTRKAEEYYNKGLSANPESIINQVGLAQLKLKTDAKATEDFFKTLRKKNKKNIEVPLAIGRAYLHHEMLKEAGAMVSEAKKIDNKNPAIYILEGDILLSVQNIKNTGDAAGKYEMSTYFDPDYALGYVKTALVYETINSKLAIDKLKTIIEKQPEYLIAYGYLGKIYTQNGFYPQAIDLYKSYFQSGLQSVSDLERYARALYFTDNFAEAKKVVDESLKTDNNHFVLNRYRMYIDAKTKNFDEGLVDAKTFFSLRDSSGYIVQDHTMYALLLAGAKRYNEAAAQYNKAISMEPEKMELYDEAASMARENKDNALAATFVKKQMARKALAANNPNYEDDVVDINTLGFDYYSAGVGILRNRVLAQELMNNKNITNRLIATDNSIDTDSLANSVDYFAKRYSQYCLHKADSVFDILITRVPDGYSGYRFKALTKHAINPDTEVGLAKPFYEKVVEIISARDDQTPATNRVLLEAYNYLGYYYYMKSDKPNTILYWNKVLEIDPTNKNALLVLEDINKEPNTQ